jgi:hypothetical protein
MQFVLEIVTGARAGEAVPLQAGKTLYVGRGQTAHLVLAEDERMSDSHFALVCEGRGCRVRDLGSRDGTLLNGAKVYEGPVRPGDKIVAGRTEFVLRVRDEEVASPAAAARNPALAPAPKPRADEAPPSAPVPRGSGEQPGSGPHDHVLRLLRQEPEPLFALLDAARTPRVVALLLGSEVEHRSLDEGPKGEEFAAWAPYLVRLRPEAPLLEAVVREGWGKSWGVFLTCKLPLEGLRKHLRRFLLVELEGGRTAYFRFYDPRVLRVYLPTCNPAEVEAFMGPIRCFLVEGAGEDALFKFTPGSQGAERAVLQLAAPGCASSL